MGQPNRGQHTFNETAHQRAAWESALCAVEASANALRDLWESREWREVLFVGCGSTHYLSRAAADLLAAHAGIPARGIPASELLLYPNAVLAARDDAEPPLLVAVSRSGQTTETLRAIDVYRQKTGSAVVALTVYPNTPMTEASDLAIVAGEAREESIAQTRSFASMYLLACGVVGVLGEDQDYLAQLQRLPGRADALLAEADETAEALGVEKGLERFFFLGSGPRYGLAREAMLKMKEMSLTSAEAFHFMEFRHGPMAMVNDRTLVVGLVSESARAHEVAVLREMQALGARILALSEDGGLNLPGAHQIALRGGVEESALGVLYLPPLQLIAYHRAMAKGLNPDMPENLTAVVVLAPEE
jgi:glucosamine--fructose-6-phosphate aminotransferase (isomerizing)